MSICVLVDLLVSARLVVRLSVCLSACLSFIVAQGVLTKTFAYAIYHNKRQTQSVENYLACVRGIRQRKAEDHKQPETTTPRLLPKARCGGPTFYISRAHDCCPLMSFGGRCRFRNSKSRADRTRESLLRLSTRKHTQEHRHPRKLCQKCLIHRLYTDPNLH